MLNHIVLQGRLTRDPELRYTQSQIPVASFTLAVDRDFADKGTGERPTDFIDCVAWRQSAEFASKYFFKGQMAIVSGRLQIREYTARDNTKRKIAEIVADSVYFGESKRRDSEPNNRGSYGGSYSAPPSSAPAPGGYAPAQNNTFTDLDDGDGELPF